MKTLSERYLSYLNCGNVFGRAQVNIFLSLVDDSYGRILEVGCGKGFFTYLLLKEKKIMHNETFGVDAFDSCQKGELRKLSNKFEFEKIKSGEDLPFPPNSFDLVFSMDVLEHVENWQKFILDQVRVAKKGGEVLIGTPNRLRLSNLLLSLFGKLSYPRSMGYDDYGEILHLQEFSRKELLDNLNSFGESVKGISFVPCWLGSNFFKIGFKRPRGVFSNFCQFWFVKFTKS